MAALYQKYLADGPLFLLYSIHDGMEYLKIPLAFWRDLCYNKTNDR